MLDVVAVHLERLGDTPQRNNHSIDVALSSTGDEELHFPASPLPSRTQHGDNPPLKVLPWTRIQTVNDDNQGKNRKSELSSFDGPHDELLHLRFDGLAKHQRVLLDGFRNERFQLRYGDQHLVRNRRDEHLNELSFVQASSFKKEASS